MGLLDILYNLQNQPAASANTEAARVWAQMHPDIGPAGAYTLSQLAGSMNPAVRDQSRQMMGAYDASQMPDYKARVEGLNLENAYRQQVAGYAAEDRPLDVLTKQMGLGGMAQEQGQRAALFPSQLSTSQSGATSAALAAKEADLNLRYRTLQMQSPGFLSSLLYQQRYGTQLPAGVSGFQNPDTKQIDFGPTPYTPEWNKAHDEVVASETATDKLLGFLKEYSKIGPSGAVYAGADASKLKEARASFLNALRVKEQLSGRYTPQLEEHWNEIYPDPTSFFAKVKGTGLIGIPDQMRDTVMAPYLRALDQSRLDTANTYQKNPYIPRRPGVLTPARH